MFASFDGQKFDVFAFLTLQLQHDLFRRLCLVKTQQGTVVLILVNIRFIRDGGGEGGDRLYTYRYTVTTTMTCIKVGSDESHFNVSQL